MTEAEFQLVRSAGFVIAGGLAFAAQRLWPHASLPGSGRVNGGLWLINVAMLSLVCGACACTVARWAEGAGLGVANVLQLPFWASLPLTVVSLDLVSYGWHRANHRLPLLWRFHRVHHSDASFTVSTGLRFHPGELLLSLPLRLAAVAAVGAPPAAVVGFEVVFTMANLFEHGNIDLPIRLERALARAVVTPALHRRHHGRRLVEFDSNFGTIFTAWDRLLGTYGDSSSAVTFHTGLPSGEPVETIAGALTLPLARRR